MNNLLKAELYKLQRNKTFWVLLLVSASLSALLHFLIITDWWMVSATEFDKAGLKELNALGTFTIPLFFNLLVSTLAGFYISIEFSQNSVIKNQIVSGNKRWQIYIAKFIVLAIGTFLIVLVTPVFTGLVEMILMGRIEQLSPSALQFLGISFALFTLQVIAFTAIIMVIAVMTEDSGKTIIISIVLTIIMFAIEKLGKTPFIEWLYDHSIFRQFTAVFQYNLAEGDALKAILIALITLAIVLVCSILYFNKKEIK